MQAQPKKAPDLPSWLAGALPFSRYQVLINDWSMHYIDVGEGPTVLLQHGNPTWCFLWRKVITSLVDAGYRVIAPDLIGLGLSDKPTKISQHTLSWHANNLKTLVELLDLRDITIVGQDWGGSIIAVMAARLPQRVKAAVFANTMIRKPPEPMRVTAFHRFSNMPVISTLAFKGLAFPLPVMQKVQGDATSIGRFEKRAYRWPLRRWRDRTAPLALARMVPTDANHPSVTTLGESDAWAKAFSGKVALVWGKRDPILGPALKRMQQLFPQAPVTTTGAGHFLQEEVPDELVDAIRSVTASA